MDNTRLPKHALNYKPRGRRDRGHPRKRWQCVNAGTGQTAQTMEDDDNDDDDELFLLDILVSNLLRSFAKLGKVMLSFIMSVRLSTRNNSAPTGQIFTKFDT
jgi:hypothetical protein